MANVDNIMHKLLSKAKFFEFDKTLRNSPFSY